jgi:hypothetical protein
MLTRSPGLAAFDEAASVMNSAQECRGFPHDTYNMVAVDRKVKPVPPAPPCMLRAARPTATGEDAAALAIDHLLLSANVQRESHLRAFPTIYGSMRHC